MKMTSLKALRCLVYLELVLIPICGTATATSFPVSELAILIFFLGTLGVIFVGLWFTAWFNDLELRIHRPQSYGLLSKPEFTALTISVVWGIVLMPFIFFGLTIYCRNTIFPLIILMIFFIVNLQIYGGLKEKGVV